MTLKPRNMTPEQKTHYAIARMHQKSGRNVTIETYPKNRQLWRIRYYNESGKPHREDGPALIVWHLNKLMAGEEYYLDGLHDLPGPHPAITQWYENGQKAKEEYIVCGNHTRKSGPAYTRWNREGKEIYRYRTETEIAEKELRENLIEEDNKKIDGGLGRKFI